MSSLRGFLGAGATADPATQPINILLVDDREQDLLALTNVLAGPGYNLITARSGQEALRRILEHEFAVILLDVLMPGMDGFEVARTIKQRDRSRHTPIIFLTAAAADIDFIYRAYSVGAVDYLAKPIDRDVVCAKVGIFVELFRKDLRIRQQAQALVEANRRAQELELMEIRLASEKHYHNLAEAIPQIVWTADVNGGLVYCNARWADYTGTPIAQAMGWRWLESVHDEDRERCDQEWRQAIAARRVHESKFRLRNRDGVYRWHLSRSVPEENRSGETTGWLGTYTDCDDLKRAIDSRDEFLLIASHELRTPLSVLQIQMQSLQMILRDGISEPNGRLKGKLDTAVRQTGRLERLIDSLLDVSRITAGRFKLELEEFDLAQAVQEVTERFADEAARANCKLETVADVATPGQWDRLRIEQVLVNLLSNAVKYGGGQPVHVTVERSGLGARLTVRDHGIGIAAEHLKRIFDRFERAVSARHYAGLGVGLYITREIVEAHGGAIHARSEPGVGSTFVVDLPCQPAVSAESADGRLPTAPARRSRTLRKTSEPAP